jgi:4-amino-4-deoxy-L-arabinose transferase-like glycosyltransferase
MKPVRLPASATNALPRLGLFALCLLYILPGLIGRDPWKSDDAATFGVMWTMAHGSLHEWLWPNIVGLPMTEDGPLTYWIGAICIKLFGWLLGDTMASRVSTIGFFLLASTSVWYTTYLLGRRTEAQPLKLAFGGQPEARDYGRTLADGALLIYLGAIGLLLHNHNTSPDTLAVALVAFTMYGAARLFDQGLRRSAIVLGITLGLLALTSAWALPIGIWIALVVLAAWRDKAALARLLLLSLPFAIGVLALWFVVLHSAQSFDNDSYEAWLAWNKRQFGLPSWDATKYLLKNVLWFAWPAWPFSAWAIYAWRRQRALHIFLPLAFFVAFVVLAIINPHSEESLMVPLLPPLVILAAFGLPTMKRGAINAVDWFSVMTLTASAAFIWVGWIAKQTGWPAQIAKNAFKLAPGFKPEFNLIAFIVAACASAGWIALVHWRVSRQPTVLWRAVVLSSGGVILCWLLLTTLWMPWVNYGKSYAGVARQLAEKLPPVQRCVDTNVGAAQRASFAYFGDIPFSSDDEQRCDFLLLQDVARNKSTEKVITRDNQQWRLLWEGHRPSDRDERFRLYARLRR